MLKIILLFIASLLNLALGLFIILKNYKNKIKDALNEIKKNILKLKMLGIHRSVRVLFIAWIKKPPVYWLSPRHK